MKKILLISGSNRIGNTNYILKMINENIENSELILLKEKNIEYCKGCLACHNIEYCVLDDDINEIISKIIDSDLIIFGVPNYFDNVSGLFKNFMDRLHPLYNGFSRGRSGGLVFPYLSEFSTVYHGPHSQRLWHSQ